MRFSYQSKGYMARVRIDKRFLIFRKTAHDDVVAEMYHIPDIFSLINIKHAIFPNRLKGLYAQWQSLKLLLSHVFLVFSYLCDGLLSRSAGLPPLSPLRTVRATFTAYGSYSSEFILF